MTAERDPWRATPEGVVVSGRLTPKGGRDAIADRAGPGDRAAAPAGLGFLGRSPFRCENPRSELLDFLGFPWILSSDMSLFNGL